VAGDLARETKGYDPAEITREFYRKADTDDHLASVLYTDLKTFLPGDILTKVDRMSMANSLETRAPLLDYRVVEYAAKIPSALKLNGKEKKYILKEAFSKMLPDDILYRKKMGFSVPLAEWLRNEIKPLAEQRLFGKKSGLANFFNISEIRNMWDQHLTGDNQYTQELWMLLAFELWWAAYHGN
jgi:asparagine synthase (glutamine-hydrolysing)